MDNKKKKFNTNRVAAYALSGVMLASVIPYNVFATENQAREAASGAIATMADADAQNTGVKGLPENRKPKTNWDEEAGKGDERN